jgi:pyruvate/2-oxoglutarate/acetoin dehydrogenase E1 component
MGKITQRNAITKALAKAMSEDPKVYFLGEDIGVYGGAFQASFGLQRKFPDQVIETPISESGFTGVAIGMAMAGLRPVVEIMFMDFTTQILDQVLNHAVKFNGMYNGQASIPLLIRTPAGAYKSYGATHSQSLENIFASVHDLKILYPYSIQDYYSLLLHSIRNLSSPIMFIENKSLYLKQGKIDEELVYSPAAKKIREGEGTLIISYGHTIDLALEASDTATVIDLVSLKPLIGEELIFDEVCKHDKVIIATESPQYASVAEHLSHRIYEECFDFITQPITIVASDDAFIPARKDKEQEVLVSVEKIAAIIKRFS